MNLTRKSKYSAMAFVAGIVLFVTACDKQHRDAKDPVVIAEDHNDAKFNTDRKDDADFVVDITEINLQEIQLAKLAQSNGMSKDVKTLGKKMEEAHSKSLEELKKLAKAKSFTIPDSLGKGTNEDYSSLTTKEGNEFDKAFCEILTEKHKKAIEKCEKASTDAEDIDVKNWANKTLPELRAHLDQTMTCGEKYK